MKHLNALLTVFLLCGFGSGSYLYGQGASLSVMAENGEYFNLKLDGRIMNEQPHQSMKFEGLNPGSYKLQVEVATQDQGNVMLKKFAMFEHGTAYKYNIKQKSNGKYVMRLYAMDPINTQPGANVPPPPSSGQPARVQPGFAPNDRPGNTMPSQWDDMGTTSINGATVSMSFMDFTGAGMSVTAGEHGASVSMGDGMGGGVDMSVNATGTGTTTTTTGTHISGGHVGHGQPQMGDCAAPTSDQQFRQLLQSVRGVRNQVTKITQSERLMQEHCLTSRQIKSLLDEIMSVNDRMALAQTGWHWVYDPENYHFTFDAFLSSSRARELQAYMDAHARGGQVAPPPGRRSPGRTEPSRRPPERRQPPPPPTSLVPGYNGPIGCPGPLMNSGQFQNALRSVQDRSFADEQKTVMRQVLRNNCVSVAQVTQMLNAFSFEDDKLEMAKFAFQSTHDIGNFYQLNNAFKFSSSTQELEAFLSTQPALNQPAGGGGMRGGPCGFPSLSPGEFQTLLNAVDNQNFADGKVTVAKQAIRNHCVTTQQVKTLLGQFNFDDDKLTLAKFSYQFTADPQNYYMVNDAFKFSSSIDELDTFLNGR